jgi:hypothetical protein
MITIQVFFSLLPSLAAGELSWWGHPAPRQGAVLAPLNPLLNRYDEWLVRVYLRSQFLTKKQIDYALDSSIGMEERQTIKVRLQSHVVIHTANRARHVSDECDCVIQRDQGKRYRLYWHRGGAVPQGGLEIYDTR